MNAELKLSKVGGTTHINLSVPSSHAETVLEAISSLLTLAGHKITNADEDKDFAVTEVFPEGSPAMLLRGLRGKEALTQTQFAKKIGISQNMLSDMERGVRPVSLKTAKRIGAEFNTAYKMFL